ncbi:glycoside hydrolase superfamily [Aspergillus pseudoustus]|uniref:glucan endo-1,3-beta-D-glucosidase n=1 Tax=Aspergillus pseudoustus TaxID=1810923 RepID=A0ABR4KB00_9EURO
MSGANGPYNHNGDAAGGNLMGDQYSDIPAIPSQHRMAGYGGRPQGEQGLNSVPENGQDWRPGLAHTQSMRTSSTATPGMDNLGPAAVGGGISGIALGVANTHDRQSGVDALTDAPGGYIPAERGYHTTGADNPYVPAPPSVGPSGSSEGLRSHETFGSNAALGAAAAPVGNWTPPSASQRSFFEPTAYQSVGPNSGGPYQRNSAYSAHDYPINPDDILDDGDDGFTSGPSRNNAAGAAAAGGAAGGIFGGLFGAKKAADVSYGPVPGAGGGIGGIEKGGQYAKPRPDGSSRKRGWIIGIVLAIVVVGAIVGGAVGGTIGNRDNSKSESSSGSSSSSDSAEDDTNSNGDLDKNSAEIKELMSMEGLHKVFPGIDYTPWGVQHPECDKWPPSQNNVTRDMAVLSQLTNTVRLYGTDCNQTEMVLHAIDRLELTDMKLWLGVWIDTNTSTNDRQLSQLYDILDNTDDHSVFKGAIIGNEALYRAGDTKEHARQNIINYMDEVRKHFEAHDINIKVATSDLGDNWDSTLTAATDVVMSNVHPFFGGVEVDNAASWTWSFWNNHNAPLTKGTSKGNVIAEVGWPSGGGNDCGDGANCPDTTSGAVASVENMNIFMADWVCQALENGTDYFWFEAFDEPWKAQYNEGKMQWEDKWGLMDPGRNLKPGIKIPDCDGKTAT